MKNKIYTFEEIDKFAHQIENKKFIETKEILMRQTDEGYTVAHKLAWSANLTDWETCDKEILMLQYEKSSYSVAHHLADYHPTWTTSDIEVLSLACFNGETVEDVLIRKGKM